MRSLLTSSEESLSRSAESSRSLEVERRAERVGRASRLHRWLTAEPEPEVVVIDLRETWTVGPLIALLDRFVESASPVWRGSGVRRLLEGATRELDEAPLRAAGYAASAGLATELLVSSIKGTSWTGLLVRLYFLALALALTRVDASWEDVERSRTVRVLASVLEPPELEEGRE